MPARLRWLACALLVLPGVTTAQSITPSAAAVQTPAAGPADALVPNAEPSSDREPSPDADPLVTAWLWNRTRVESWRFFQPTLANVDPHYTFPANRADLGVRVLGRHLDLSGEFSYVRAERLPTDAIGPGGLGSGAFYFAASGLPYSYQMFLSEMTVSAHTANRRLELTVGRMPHLSGAEGARVVGETMTPPFLELRRRRLDGRLLGTFEWSQYHRRFDGARARFDQGRAYAGAGAFFVSQGGYEESANLTIPKLGVATSVVGLRHGDAAESQVFAHVYRDRRAIDIRPDNAGQPTMQADISVFSAGASHLGTRRVGAGALDWVLWGTAQGGDWYGEPHRAWAGAVEAGYRWNQHEWDPWLRVGGSHASGDSAPGDDRHGTFFPLLQDTQTFAPSMLYAHMNLRDAFATFGVTPHPRGRLQVELHRLRLADAADRWYQGSGATAREGRFFGYSARTSGGALSLGTTLDTTLDVRFSRYWSIRGYLGRTWGGPVVRNLFRTDRMLFWYVENRVGLAVGGSR